MPRLGTERSNQIYESTKQAIPTDVLFQASPW
jgi:hypothetical protein